MFSHKSLNWCNILSKIFRLYLPFLVFCNNSSSIHKRTDKNKVKYTAMKNRTNKILFSKVKYNVFFFIVFPSIFDTYCTYTCVHSESCSYCGLLIHESTRSAFQLNCRYSDDATSLARLLPDAASKSWSFFYTLHTITIMKTLYCWLITCKSPLPWGFSVFGKYCHSGSFPVVKETNLILLLI